MLVYFAVTDPLFVHSRSCSTSLFVVPGSPKLPCGVRAPRLAVLASALTVALTLVVCPAKAKAQSLSLLPYTPAVSVSLVAAADATNAAAANASSNPILAAVQPILQGRAFTCVPLPLSSSGKAPAAIIMLNYGAPMAGESVFVKPLTGGVCTAAGTTDQASQTKGFYVTLDATGAAVVTFQPPDQAGIYKMYTRLFNGTTILPFQTL